MPLIVDTYNVLHVTGVLPPELAGLDIADLARLIAASRYRREPVTLVCDGTPPLGDPTGAVPASVTAVFAGPGRSADDEIVRRIRQSSVPRQLLIVTSDRQIIREARRRRCRIATSETFLRHLARDQTTSPAATRAPAPPRDTEHWLREFGLPRPMNAPAAPPESPADSPAPATPASPPPDSDTTPEVRTGTHPPGPADALPPELIDEATALWRAAHRRRP